MIGRTFGGGDEWNCGFSLAPSGVSNYSDCITLAQTLSGLWVTDVWDASGTSTLWPANVTYTSCRVAAMDGDNHTSAVATYTLSSPNYGAGTGSALPAECAIVCSLQSVEPGPSGRGRMYLPNIVASGVDVNGQLTSTAQNAIVTNLKVFFDAVNALSAYGNLIVASQAQSAGFTLKSIRVGNVVDAQRRRRNAVGENYQVMDLA